MLNQNTDDEAKLQKLGQRVRDGWAKQNPVQEKSIKTVKDAVREQWEQEQKVKRESQPLPDVTKSKRQPPQPDPER